MDLPHGYEPLRVNVQTNDMVAGIICRRPDGGVSDVRVVLPRPTRLGICPSCGRDMKQSDRQSGVMFCKAGHVMVVQTNTGFKPSAVVRTKRMIPKKIRSGAFPPTKVTPRAVRTEDTDLVAVIEQAMKEMVL